MNNQQKKSLLEIARNTAKALRSQRTKGKQVKHAYRKVLVRLEGMPLMLEVEVHGDSSYYKATRRDGSVLVAKTLFT